MYLWFWNKFVEILFVLGMKDCGCGDVIIIIYGFGSFIFGLSVKNGKWCYWKCYLLVMCVDKI